MSLYLVLNIFIIGTIFLSFDKKVAFYRHFKSLFIAIIIVGCIFIPWDIWFAEKGVWGFNNEYLLGIDYFRLPLEEWLFFITVPFSCVFIHYVLKAYFKKIIQWRYTTLLWYVFSVFLLIVGILNYDQFYTFTVFSLCSIAIGIITYINSIFMRDFLRTYLVCFIPFIIVNGILTGSLTEKPIVWYNEDQIIGWRIGTIPIEDTVYNMLLVVLATFFTSNFQAKKTSLK
jgi:lycopene cyclase domain-containing protein